MTVDVEHLVSSWLRSQQEVEDLVDDRVYTEVPREAVFPLVRLTLVATTFSTTRPLHVARSLLQIDTYGGPKRTAWQAFSVVSDLMDSDLVGRHDDGVVSDVHFFNVRYLPDREYKPPKPRYIADVQITTHP